VSYPNATNLTNIDITSPADLVTLSHELSGGVLGVGLSFLIWIMLFIFISRVSRSWKGALAVSSFIAFLFNLLLVSLEMLTGWFAAIPLIFFGLSMFIQN